MLQTQRGTQESTKKLGSDCERTKARVERGGGCGRRTRGEGPLRLALECGPFLSLKRSSVPDTYVPPLQ